MKRIAYSFLIFFVVFASDLFAQGTVWGFSGGFDYGQPNSSYARSIPPPSFQFYPGFTGGIEIGYFDWNAVSWSIRFQYDRKGEILHTPYITESYSADLLEIPLTIKIPLNKNFWHEYFFIGPVLDACLGGDPEFGSAGALLPGVMFGFGVTSPVSPGLEEYLEVGYTHYFSNDFISEPYHDIHLSFGMLFDLE